MTDQSIITRAAGDGPAEGKTEGKAAPVEALFPRLGDNFPTLVDRGVEFFVASNDSLRPYLNLAPYGHTLSWLDFTLTTRNGWDTGEFLNLFNVINGIAFGDRGIPMPQWVMVDLILMPSAAVIAGLSQKAFTAMLEAAPVDETTTHLRRVHERIKSSGYSGPIPVGGYCAAPSAAPGTWVGWSLWSLMPHVGLARTLKAIALSTYQTQRLDGVTQYDNSALKVHTGFGRLRIVVAHVPFHTSPASFVYENDFTAPPADPEQQPSFLLYPADVERQRDMQLAIEAGTSEFFVLSPGHVIDGGKARVPIVEIRRGR